MNGVTFDAASLERVMRAMAVEAYADIVADALTDLTYLAEAEAKAGTPYITGHLRRSEVSDVSHVRDSSDPHGKLEARTSYAGFIEEGVWPGGSKTLRTQPGGYRMFEKALARAQGAGSNVLSRVARDIAARWAKP